MNENQPIRTFLVIVDESKEMQIALRYASWHARQTQNCRVALLYVVKPSEIQPWAGVDEALTEDALARAELKLKEYEEQVENSSGVKPLLFIRKGDIRSQLLRLLDEQPDISVLVLAAQTGEAGPGPLISYLTGVKGIRALKIPLVIVPDTYQLPPDKTSV